MEKNKKYQSLLPVLLTSLFVGLLSACGGGAGNTGSSGNTSTVAIKTDGRQFNGQVAKGRIVGARVQAYALDKAGNKSANVFSSALTGDDGSYTITVPDGVNSFMLEVASAPGATMYDEVTQADLPFPADLKLRSVVKQGSNPESVYWGSVTPLTELIVQVAENAGSLTPANIDKARAGVQALLGFDPQRVSIIHTTADTSSNSYVDEKIQGLSLTAISYLAFNKAFSCNDPLQGARVACVVKKIANAGKLDGNTFNLSEDVRAAMRAALEQVATDESLNKSGKNSVAGIGAFLSASLPSPAPEADNIIATKQLFSSLRNNLYAVTNSQNSGGLDLRLNAVKADFENATAPLNKDLLIWSKTIADGIDQYNKYTSGQSRETTVTGLFYGPAPLWRGYQNIGNLGDCSAMRDPLNVASTPAQAKGMECRFSRLALPGTFKYSYKYQVEWVELIDRIWLEPVANDSSRFNYKSELVKQKAVFAWNEEKNDFIRRPANPADTVIIDAYSGNAFTGQISFAMQARNLYALVVQGTMPPRSDGNGQLTSDYEKWDIHAGRTGLPDGSFRYDFTGEFISYVKSNMNSRLSLDKGSYATVDLDYKGNLQKNGVKEFNLAITGEAGNSKVHGELKLGNASTDKNGVSYQPNRLDFVGTVSNSLGLSSAAELFNGKLTVERFGYGSFDSAKPESASNFVRKSVAASGVIQVPGRPPLKLNLNGSNDAFGSNSLIAQYDDGSNVINAQMSESLTKQKIVRVSSTSGVSFDVFGSNLVADILKDGAKVGWLDMKAGRISYTDGSFETIK
ncbi:hypothetical protein [Undibacterium sp. TS12]|uniref:hypothetical protein n=1 Tax=Undibacterium sp. TS12 TaxID=2908202 RepID=UPI001F4CC60C|nr:hypothetical protein [Undibacterium sp. TS12]MCH8618888.1 hypothetical protein [Undibacterium sp. TS12]